MKRGRAPLALGAIALGLAVPLACTVFNGVTVPAAGDDAAVPDSAAADVAPEGGDIVYLSLDDAARVCSLVFECGLLAESITSSIAVPIDPTSFSSCMDWLAGPLPPDRIGVATQHAIFACIAAAGSCAAAAPCLPLEYFGAGDPRCPADAGADASGESCVDDGGAVLRCAGSYALHCGSAYYASGSSCIVGTDGSHWCAIDTSCPSTTSCVGQLLDYCGSPAALDERVNCAASGYSCGIDSEAGAPDCLSTTTDIACGSVGSSCSGGSVAVCDGDEESIYDCSALGAVCTHTDGPARCARTSDTCSPYDANSNTCSGTSISLCIGGEPTAFDCAQIGQSCVVGQGSQSSHCG